MHTGRDIRSQNLHFGFRWIFGSNQDVSRSLLYSLSKIYFNNLLGLFSRLDSRFFLPDFHFLPTLNNSNKPIINMQRSNESKSTITSTYQDQSDTQVAASVVVGKAVCGEKVEERASFDSS